MNTANGLPIVMIVRHGEKPGIPGEPPMGFDELGRIDIHSLTPRGWQRAGALVSLFCHLRTDVPVRTPGVIFAAKRYGEPETESGQKATSDSDPELQVADSQRHLGARAFQTVLPLAESLGLTEQLETYCLSEETVLAAEIKSNLRHRGPVLIAWEHKRIPVIVSALQASRSEMKWLGERFDMVWILTPDGSGYSLTAHAQRLLARDNEIDARTDAFVRAFNATRIV